MRRLLLFAKRPRPGKVKTRLCPPLTPPQAVELYRAFLADQLRWLADFPASTRTELCADGAWGAADGPTDGADLLTLQGEGDLGCRLLAAFRRCRADGAEATVVVGVDSPTLPTRRVEQAFERLERGADAAVAPADDGGYVLIGQREPQPALFEEIDWGGPTVFEETRRRAAERGISLAEVEGWYDVDDLAGLERLREELRDEAPRRRAPESARWLGRSSWPIAPRGGRAPG